MIPLNFKKFRKKADVLPKPYPQLVSQIALQNFKRSRSRGGKSRRRSRRIDKAARPVYEKLYQRVRTANESSAHADRFAQRPHLNVDVTCQAQGGDKPGAFWADHTRRVCFIDEQKCSEFVLEIDDRSEICEVAIHAEDGLGRDKGLFVRVVLSGPGQMVPQPFDIVVWKHAYGSAGELRPIDNAGVNQFIQYDGVPGAGQAAQRAKRSAVPAAEQ